MVNNNNSKTYTESRIVSWTDAPHSTAIQHKEKEEKRDGNGKKKTDNKKQVIVPILIALAMLTQTVSAQTVNAQTQLDTYITDALTNNLVLQQKNITLEKSLLALKDAKSYYLPTSSFDGSYTLSQGGRTIAIPVGDLLNPVYQTLNQLTASNKFPTIENVEEQLLPNNFYDVRLKTSMPVYNPALKFNKNVKQQEVKLKENEISIYKRELVKSIKQSYYNILMADKAIHIYTSALAVVNENLRTNQSLLQNGKGLPAYVSRAEAEVKRVETELSNAANEKQKAIAYFNSLRNANLTETVKLEDVNLPEETQKAVTEYTDNINNREELRSLSIAKDINYQTLKFNKAYHAPRVNAFLDLAMQDFNFAVKKNSFFYLAGVQMSVPIFAGNRNLNAIRQSELDIRQIDIQDKDLRQNLELAAFTSKSNAKNSYNNFLNSIKQEESSTKYFKLIDRGYKEGINNYIELLDARNQLTQSQLQKELTRYRLLAALADYERQTSSYNIN
jgi:outer membrane protein TolC